MKFIRFIFHSLAPLGEGARKADEELCSEVWFKSFEFSSASSPSFRATFPQLGKGEVSAL